MSKYGKRTHNWFESVINVVGGEERADALLRGELVVVEKPTGVALPKKKMRDKKSSSIVHVDRSIAPTYPSWMKEVMHPELEKTGPAQFDVKELEFWLHDGQKDGKWIEGYKIHEHLKSNNMLESCVGLRDLEEIQKRGIEFFRQHFKGKAVFGWKSVVRHSDGDLGAPCLCEGDGKVILFWGWLFDRWSDSNPAPRFAK